MDAGHKECRTGRINIVTLIYIILDKRVIQNTGYSRDVVQDNMNARQYGSRTV